MSHPFTPSSEHPLLVFGGPYSNLEATQAIHAEAERLGIPSGNTLCTGDLVAYCAAPEETVNYIREWGIAVVLGNCEQSLSENADDCGCGFEEGSTCSLLSVGWYNYSRPRVSQNNKQWMGSLPEQIRFNYCGFNCLSIHGALHSINQFIFPSSDRRDKHTQIQQADCDLMITGHSGIPFGEQVAESKAWLNAGVIGMPANNGSSKTWYMLITPEHDCLRISWHPLEYDTLTAANAMTTAGLTYGYEKALISGIWPSTDILPAAEVNMTGKPLYLKELRLRPKS